MESDAESAFAFTERLRDIEELLNAPCLRCLALRLVIIYDWMEMNVSQVLGNQRLPNQTLLLEGTDYESLAGHGINTYFIVNEPY